MMIDAKARNVLDGGGEMGALMRVTDWTKSAVGPVERWPQSLRTAPSILLETAFPMYIAWGKDFTQFYNDGYRPILGSTKRRPVGGANKSRKGFAGAKEGGAGDGCHGSRLIREKCSARTASAYKLVRPARTPFSTGLAA